MARYITPTIAYVNADPHIGYALELIQADVLARAWRAQGEEVFFNTGSDEHGQKIFEAAQKQGKNVQEYVDHYANELRKLKGALDLSPDNFIRTTDAHHIEAAQEMWRRCMAAGDIYKQTYSGLYCIGCEAYKTEHELIDGHCELHPSLVPILIEEENYFFALSKYQERLVEYLNRSDVVIPEWRRQEALNFVQAGLEDFSVSREAARLSWGVPVPGDDSQVMYVWFDALACYLSTLGWPKSTDLFQKFWEEGTTLQMAGKDQVRFQSVMWQAMLMSADIKNTDQVFYHGFINSGGQRMSKSLGNVISPYELVAKYGTDATRYLLLRHVHPTEDSDVTWERLDEWYTANLVNGLGNLVARVMQMAQKNLNIPVQIPADANNPLPHLAENLNSFEFQKYLDLLWEHMKKVDEHIAFSQPFLHVMSEDPNEKETAHKNIAGQVIWLYRFATHLKPFMPETSSRILAAVRENKKPENLFPRLP